MFAVINYESVILPRLSCTKYQFEMGKYDFFLTNRQKSPNLEFSIYTEQKGIMFMVTIMDMISKQSNSCCYCSMESLKYVLWSIAIRTVCLLFSKLSNPIQGPENI